MATSDPVKFAVRSPAQRYVLAVQHVGQVEDTFQRAALSDPAGEQSDALKDQRANLARLHTDLAALEKAARDDGADTEALKQSYAGGITVAQFVPGPGGQPGV